MNVDEPSRGGVAVRAGIWPVAIGVVGAVVGLAPWLLGGMRLPLQNLWREPTAPEEMPLVLLPFNQYTVAGLIGLLGVGAAITGLLTRPLVGRLGPSAVVRVAAGLLAVQLVAITQTAITVGLGLRPGIMSAIYLAGLTAIALMASGLGLLAFFLIARGRPPQALIGLTLGAIALSYWAPIVLLVNVLMARFTVLLYVLAPVSAVLVGVAIGWCGLRGKGHVAAAVGSLLLLWVLPAAMHGVSFGLGSRVLLPRPAELASAVLQASGRVLLDASLYGVGIATVVAVVVLAGRAVRPVAG